MISKKNIWQITTGSIALILIIVLMIGLSENNRKLDAILLDSGIETTGNITKKNSPGMDEHGSLWYDFRAGDSLVNGYQLIYTYDEYRKAIVGKQYTVRYLPGDLKTYKLFLDEMIQEKD